MRIEAKSWALAGLLAAAAWPHALAGAEIGVVLIPNAGEDIRDFEQTIDRHIASLGIYLPLSNREGNWAYRMAFPAADLREKWRHDGSDCGMSLNLAWEPWDYNATAGYTSLDDIRFGRMDDYLRTFARDVKDFGHSVRIRFGQEMMSSRDPTDPASAWYPWQDKPQAYVEAFRHLREIFRQEGAANAAFVWAPMNDTVWRFRNQPGPGIDPRSCLASYYPGSDAVDWLGIDGYNFASEYNGSFFFDELFGDAYRILSGHDDFFGAKPIMIGEFATVDGPRKAEWIADAFWRMTTADYSEIRAFYWFNVNKWEDGQMRMFGINDPDEIEAFRTAMGNSLFESHPIPEPSGSQLIWAGALFLLIVAVRKTQAESGSGADLGASNPTLSSSVDPASGGRTAGAGPCRCRRRGRQKASGRWN